MPLITDIDKQVEDATSFVQFGQPVGTAFRRLKKSGFAEPESVLKQSVNLTWLLSHQGVPFEEIRSRLQPMVRRGMEVYALVEGSLMMRGSHDLMLLALAVLVQDTALLEQVSGLVQEADEESPKYYAAVAGIMKFHVLREPLRMQKQLELFWSFRGKPAMLRVPSRMFIQAFVARDLKKLHRERGKVEQEFWTNLGFPREHKPENLTLDFRDYNRFWPWPEAVLLRLLDAEAPPDIDRFWFPAPLCR